MPAELESPSVEVFISYAREDLDLVRRLADALRARGRSVWIDLAGLYVGEAWWPTLCQAIDAANAVLFVLSPDSAASGPCRAELDHAVERGKRILPLAWRDPGGMELPPVVRQTHWLLPSPGAGLDAVVDALVGALDSDPAWLRGHTRWLQWALDWDRRSRPDALLLRGEHLDEARRWLAGASPSREPTPIPIQQLLIDASDRAERLRRARRDAEEGRHEQALALLLRVADDGIDAIGVDGHALLFASLQRLRRSEPLRPADFGTERVAIGRGGGVLAASDGERATAWDLGERPARRLAAFDVLGIDVPVLSPAGDRFLTGRDSSAALRDAGGGAVTTIDLDEETSTEAAFSSDGRWLALADGARVRLLAAADGRLAWTADHGKTVGIDAVAFDPAGTGLLVRSPERLRLLAVETGALHWEAASGARAAFWSARFSSNGSWVVAARGNRRLTVYRCDDGDVAATPAGPAGDEFQDAWFTDGDRGLVAFDGMYLRSWAWPGPKGQGRQAGDRSLFALAPAGARVALSSKDRSGRVALRDTRTGEVIDSLGRHTSAVTALAWSPDGEHLVSGDEDGLVVLWAMSTRSVHATLEAGGGRIVLLSALPDSSGVAVGCGDGAVRIWRFAPSLDVRRLPAALRGVSISSRAGLAVGLPHDRDRPAVLLDGEGTGAHGELSPGGVGIRACAFSPDGRWLAAIGDDDGVRLVDTATLDAVAGWPGPEDAIRVAFSASGTRLVVSSSERCAVWDVERRALVLALGSKYSGIVDAALSPDGRTLAVAEVRYEIAGPVRTVINDGARTVDLDTGETAAQLASRDDPARHRYSRLAFAPDGSTVLLVRDFDADAVIVDASTGAVVRAFGDESSRTSVAVWAPDGRVVIANQDDAVVVWSAADGTIVARLEDQSRLRGVVFADDGVLAATVSSHGVWIWDRASWTPLANLFDGVDRFPASAVFSASGQWLVVVESDGRAAWYPVGRRALCDAARPWAQAGDGVAMGAVRDPSGVG